jgi:hypothetical protein
MVRIRRGPGTVTVCNEASNIASYETLLELTGFLNGLLASEFFPLWITPEHPHLLSLAGQATTTDPLE